MKRKLFVLCAVVVMLLLACASALAADDPLRVAIQMSTYTFTEPQTVNVSIQVTNTTDEDMPGAVTLYDPDGNKIEAFGDPILTAGSSKVWEGTLNVTQAQLDAGKVTYRLRYFFYDESGKLAAKSRPFSKGITYEGAVASLEINRTISPTTAGNKQKVTVTYDLINTGNIDLTDVVVTENKNISSKPQTVARIAAGSKETVTFTVEMGKKDLTSAATITYKAGGETYTKTKDTATIAYGEMNLSAALSADKKGGAPGDIVRLTLTLKNSGKSDYTDVTVTDGNQNVIFRDETVPAGKTVTLTKDVTVSATEDYLFHVTATNSAGRTVETSTGAVKIQAVSAGDVITLAVDASSNHEVLYALPGVVKFRVAVTNKSNSDVKNVSVSASGMTLYTFDTLLAGETREFTRDVSISMAGQYQFTASTKNQLGEVVRFPSNIVYISYSVPTAVPTAAPIPTPAAPKLEEMPTEAEVMAETAELQYYLHLAAYILGGIGATGVLLLVIGLIRGAVLKRRIHDSMEVVEPRDYATPNSMPDSYEATKPSATASNAADAADDEPQA